MNIAAPRKKAFDGSPDGWCSRDARGNKPGIHAQFSPPNEIPAFSIQEKQERNLPDVGLAAWPFHRKDYPRQAGLSAISRMATDCT